MVSFLVSYLCATAAMDNCTAWADQSWQGAQAPTQCEAALPAERKRLEKEYKNFFVHVECESQASGE